MRLHQVKKFCKKMALIICVIGTTLGDTAYAAVSSASGEEWSYIGFDEIRYFREEKLLRLRDIAANYSYVSDYSYFFIDLDGNLVEHPQLNSQHLFNVTADDGYVDIYNALGECLPRIYIDDPEWQKMIGGISTVKGDLVWIEEIEPSLNKTSIFIKAVNVDNNEEIYKIDCSSYVDAENKITISEYINYDDKPILIFNFFSIDLNTGKIIGGKEMDTDGTSRDVNGYRSSGFRNDGYRSIVDIYGHNILEDDSRFRDIGRISEGLFFNAEDCSFYDIELKKVIDLSEYPLYLYHTSNGDGWFRQGFYFKDGYCRLLAENDDGIKFYGLIDKNGNFVIDWTTEYFDYYGTVADGVLLLNDGGESRGEFPGLDTTDYLYDLNTSEIVEVADEVFRGIQVDNKVYYLKDHELYCYDCITHESVKMEIKGLEVIPDE